MRCLQIKNLKQLILDTVNLAGYSKSSGFVGYSGRAGRFVGGMAETAVASWCDMFGRDVSEWMLVSSLHANDDEVGKFGDAELDERDQQLVDHLCSHGALRRFSYLTRFGNDYESISRSSSIEKVDLDLVTFSVCELGRDIVRRLLIARMLVYGLRGHCFLVSEKKGLIFYPHDDTGFGVIVFGSTPIREHAAAFLERAGSVEGFQSVAAR